MKQMEMPKDSELPARAALKAYHINVITEAACVWPGPVRLGLLPELLKSSIEIGLCLLVHSSRDYPFCNDALAFGQSLMVVPAWHCFVRSQSSIRLNHAGMIQFPQVVADQTNPAIHLSRHHNCCCVRHMLTAAR